MVFVDVPNQSYRSEIQFLSCFIYRFVNPIEMENRPEPETERGLFTLGCSPIAWFSVSTSALETGPEVSMTVSTTLSHPRQPERGLNVLNTGIVL